MKKWALIEKDGKFGLINKRGKVIVEPVYDYIGFFGVERKGWAMVESNGKYGFINKHGKLVVEPVNIME